MTNSKLYKARDGKSDKCLQQFGLQQRKTVTDRTRPSCELESAVERCDHTRERETPSFHLSVCAGSETQAPNTAVKHNLGCSTPKAKMPETAEAVSATLTTNRNCTIEISNVTANHILINPKVYMSSGFSHHPPQPTIRTNMTEVCSFTKDDNTATGAVGLMTYDLFHKSRSSTERMAVMFSVPFDRNLYKNRLAVGVIEQSSACDKALCDRMYDGKNQSGFTRAEASGSGLVYQTRELDVRATMSSIGKAIIKVELYDKMGH
ncbi:bryoporin-like isoform X1 [Solea solea]|uniref:bryoporin-like isoform X1 n=1 Tax=Solea solea TaxID=90069 RepID=UPI002729B065|nr:bryoporin-like isoform X1 [Solea solea]